MISDATMQKLKAELKVDEAVRQFPYDDAGIPLTAKGKISIGIGRNLTDKGLSPDEIDYLFQNDVNDAYRQAQTLQWFTQLDEPRQAVILNMIFNGGLHGVLGFGKMIAAIQVHDYPTASKQMLDSLWAKQVGPRATKLAARMLTGQWG